jgi:hypothetical protein
VTKLSAAQIAGIVKYNGASTGSSFAYSLYNPDTDGPIFVAIALAESGGETTASHKNTNGSTDYGLWQINSVHKELLEQHKPWDNPNNNFQMAYELYAGRKGKFTDWVTYTTGTYATNMAAATLAWGNPDTSQADHNAVADAANATYDAATAIPSLLATLTKASTWVRVGMGLAGAVLLIIVLGVLMKGNLPIPGPLGKAVKAATA